MPALDAGDLKQETGKLTDPQYAVVKQLRMPVAVVITLQNKGVISSALIEDLVGRLQVRNSADAACTAGSALQSFVS